MQSQYVMSCGCLLHEKDLAVKENKYTCPEHAWSEIEKVLKFCIRCGSSIIASKMGTEKLYCTECRTEIDQLMSYFYVHDCDYFDPALQLMSKEQIQEAMMTNLLMGFDFIFITPERKSRADNKKVKINPAERIAAYEFKDDVLNLLKEITDEHRGIAA